MTGFKLGQREQSWWGAGLWPVAGVLYQQKRQ